MYRHPFEDEQKFPGLSETQKELIAPFFLPWKTRARKVIFEQGELARSFYFLDTGEVLIRYKPYDGPALDVSHITAGQVFGWSAALGHSTYSSSAICLSNCEGTLISKRNLQLLCRQYPDTGTIIIEHLADLIAERMGNTHATVVSILLSSVDANP